MMASLRVQSDTSQFPSLVSAMLFTTSEKADAGRTGDRPVQQKKKVSTNARADLVNRFFRSCFHVIFV